MKKTLRSEMMKKPPTKYSLLILVGSRAPILTERHRRTSSKRKLVVHPESLAPVDMARVMAVKQELRGRMKNWMSSRTIL